MYEKETLKLIQFSSHMARALAITPLSLEEALGLYKFLVGTKQDQGGKDILGCLKQGLVTEIEVVRLLFEHTYTTLLSKNGWPKVPEKLLNMEEVYNMIEIAVFGRPANVIAVDAAPPTNEELIQLTNGGTLIK